MTPRRRRRRASRSREVDLSRYASIMDDWEAFSAAAVRPEPTVFRVTRHRIDEAALIGRLAARGFRTRSLDGQPGLHEVVDGPGPLSATPEHWLGLVYVQQASTAVAAPALGVRPGDRVLDMCAAPGGKTTHLSELMEGRGCLVANEISEPRIRGLLGNLYRLGHTNVIVTSGDAREAPEGALFDHILLDAPCSGEGTLRRRGGKPPNQSESFSRYVTGAQRSLLERAVALLRPGGTVLYVTCTFAPEENEAVVSDALGRLPVEIEPLDLPVAHAPGVTAFEGASFDPRVEATARIYPHHLDSGGLYIARLRKLDDGTRTDTGWTSVPKRWAGEESEAVDLGSGVDATVERFGLDLPAVTRWLERGGRGWMHGVDEWPVDAWGLSGTAPEAEDEPWRVISVGIRAIDFDSRGRPRPSNDLLRLAGPTGGPRSIEVDDAELAALLDRKAVACALDDRGPIQIEWRDDVIGRGAVTVDGLKSEIPKARAADLSRAL